MSTTDELAMMQRIIELQAELEAHRIALGNVLALRAPDIDGEKLLEWARTEVACG